jgi:hypothetical protein
MSVGRSEESFGATQLDEIGVRVAAHRGVTGRILRQIFGNVDSNIEYRSRSRAPRTATHDNTPGIIVSASSSALLANTFTTETDAANYIIVALRSTRTIHPNLTVRGWLLGCDGYTCLPSGVVTDPSAGYPQGAALFIFARPQARATPTPSMV